jgi:hypothetical protein
MATVSAVLAEAARLGAALRADRDRIIAQSSSALTPELAKAIDLVRTEPLAVLVRPVSPPTSCCPNCHGKRFFARHERFTWICAKCHPPVDTSKKVWHEAVEARDV